MCPSCMLISVFNYNSRLKTVCDKWSTWYDSIAMYIYLIVTISFIFCTGTCIYQILLSQLFNSETVIFPFFGPMLII